MEMLSGDVSNMYGPNPDSLANQQHGIMATHLSVWNDRTSFWEDNLFPTTLKAVRNPENSKPKLGVRSFNPMISNDSWLIFPT
jgi:hypothetical protein